MQIGVSPGNCALLGVLKGSFSSNQGCHITHFKTVIVLFRSPCHFRRTFVSKKERPTYSHCFFCTIWIPKSVKAEATVMRPNWSFWEHNAPNMRLGRSTKRSPAALLARNPTSETFHLFSLAKLFSSSTCQWDKRCLFHPPILTSERIK